MSDMTLADLKANPKNPRSITDGKKKMLVKALKRFGDLGGIVFNRRSGQLVGGHQRTEALSQLMPAAKVAIDKIYGTKTEQGTVAEGYVELGEIRHSYREVDWDAATEKAANLAANKGAGEFDLNMVKEWMGELKFDDFNLDLTMFDENERNALFPETEIIDEDIPDDIDDPVQAEAKVQSGDVWILGEHKLICGNSADFITLEKLMLDERADIIFTDPPYNQAGAGQTSAAGIRKSYAMLAASDWDYEFNFNDVSGNMLAFLNENASVYVCTSPHLAGDIWAWMKSWSKFFGCCVWVKPSPMPSLHKRHWTWGTELICYATRGKHTFNFPDEGHALNYWSIQRNSGGNSDHPTMKPTALPDHAIKHSSKPGDVVLDCFGGAGSTLLACEINHRKARLVELDPMYCDLIIARWEKLSGNVAELVNDGGRGIAEDA